MCSKYEVYCFDSQLIGARVECDRLTCEGNHTAFNLFCRQHYKKKEVFYHVNRKQLGEYWRCVINDRDTFCPEKCYKYSVCNYMSIVYNELQDSYFLYPKNDQTNSPYQPILWRVFTEGIDKNIKRFLLEIAKSIPHQGLVLNYAQTR